jgi:hypothetical protein
LSINWQSGLVIREILHLNEQNTYMYKSTISLLNKLNIATPFTPIYLVLPAVDTKGNATQAACEQEEQQTHEPD